MRPTDSENPKSCRLKRTLFCYRVNRESEKNGVWCEKKSICRLFLIHDVNRLRTVPIELDAPGLAESDRILANFVRWSANIVVIGIHLHAQCRGSKALSVGIRSEFSVVYRDKLVEE